MNETVIVPVSAIREVCESAVSRYERSLSKGHTAAFPDYQEAFGKLNGLALLFVNEPELYGLIHDHRERLTRLFLGDYYPPASSGPEALPPVSLQGAAQEALS